MERRLEVALDALRDLETFVHLCVSTWAIRINDLQHIAAQLHQAVEVLEAVLYDWRAGGAR